LEKLTNPSEYEGARWTASPELIQEEIGRVRDIGFFECGGHELLGGVLVVKGLLSHNRKYGGKQSLRVRLEYPYRFPEIEPAVFDHDKVFKPSPRGHQFENWSLCLQFPDSGQFSKDALVLTGEVLGASLNWVAKRNIFERTGKWPGDEEHGFAGPYRRLAVECAAESGNLVLQVWTDWTLRSGICPNLGASCPCLSGRKLAECHRRLGDLICKAVFHAIREGSSNGRR
jgi:hypothetical protein